MARDRVRTKRSIPVQVNTRHDACRPESRGEARLVPEDSIASPCRSSSRAQIHALRRGSGRGTQSRMATPSRSPAQLSVIG